MARRLPEAKKVYLEISVDEAKRCLEEVSSDEIRKQIQDKLKHVDFWNFMRDCKHLRAETADFHITGLGNPSWHLYCKNKDNKTQNWNRAHYTGSGNDEEIVEITGHCSEENYPLYKR